MSLTLDPRNPTIEPLDPRTDAPTVRGKVLSLHEAAATGDRTAVGWHLARGVAPGARSEHGWTALHLACFGGHLRIAQQLLGAGAGVDDRSRSAGSCTGATPLHLATGAGHELVVAALLSAEADPTLRDDAGYTPLHLASERGDLPIVRRLLKARVPIDPQVGDTTALELARRGRHLAVVALLRQLGAR